MDSAARIGALGLPLPNPAYLFGAIAFGLVGFAAWRYGRKAERVRARWLGVALMVYPYFVSQTWLLYGVGAVLCAALLLDRG
jgi:hypothetical protein